MNIANKNKPLLITIAISHYCEKARWALDYFNIDYLEENHSPPCHRKYTSHYGGSSVPLLVINGHTFIDSRDIMHYLDTIAPNYQFYPSDPELRHHAETLEILFDEKLGEAIRSWVYYFEVRQPWKLLAAWSQGSNAIEKIKCAVAFPITTTIIKKNFNLTSEGKETALQDIKDVFNLVDRKLNLGQKYLVSDRLSSVDITFATLASPVIRPINHPIYNSQLSKLPMEMAEVIKELRNTLAGELVMRLYRDHR